VTLIDDLNNNDSSNEGNQLESVVDMMKKNKNSYQNEDILLNDDVPERRDTKVKMKP